MTPRERADYFADRWPAACTGQRWKKTEEKRRETVLRCMREVRGPLVTTSDAAFGRDEVTALFCYLRHLARPDDLVAAEEWMKCVDDYHTYNRAKQADWHERKLYGHGKNKFDRNRFKGEATATRGPLDDLDPEEVRKRHMSFASRHQKKQRAERKAAKQAAPKAPAPAREPARAAPAAASGGVILLPCSVILLPWTEVPAEYAPDPAYVPPAEGDNPF